MQKLTSALQAWQRLLGPEYVITDDKRLVKAQTATFATTHQIPAILRPGDRAEVQACVQVANQYKTPIYPISKGKNWGYGSQVPAQDGSVILDLSRLNHIVDYNEELAYVTVEPGVTQQQLYDFLQESQSNLFMSATGGPSDSSLIGNTIERGVGKGPHGDRFSHVCGFEVVLPTGEWIHTGLGRFADAKAAPSHRWGVGPYLDGLFTQSNLGIVTQMTFWLLPKPQHFQIFWYTLQDEEQLGPLIDRLRELMLSGLLQTPSLISNDYRTISYGQRYPWAETAGQTPLPTVDRARLREKWDTGLWFGEGALYSLSPEHGQLTRQLIRQALEPTVTALYFFDEAMAQLPRSTLEQQFPGFDIDELMAWYGQNLQLGVPTEMAITMAYWRKQTEIPQEMDPDRDGCGFLWCAPVVPFVRHLLREALTIIEETIWAYGFEPSVALNCITARSVYITAAIIYDRTTAGQDQQAFACYKTLMQKLTTAGYFPYRLGIQSMDQLPPTRDDTGKLLKALKEALDPNDILAPGRYDFRQDWPTLD